MKVMNFALIIFLYLFCVNVYALSSDLEVQHVLDQAREKYNLPAISLSIKLPRERARNYISGYCSLSTKQQISAETLFQVGSITKTFTATIIFKLAEQNKLNLTDTLGRWLPQYPRWKNITIDDLLRHRSGIYNYTCGDTFDRLLRTHPEKYWSLSELADIAYRHADLSDPGQTFNYTNTDYILLGMIIEKVTNIPLEQVFQQYFMQYGLKNTFYMPATYPD